MNNPDDSGYLSSVRNRFEAAKSSQRPLLKRFVKPNPDSMGSLQRMVGELSAFYIEEPGYRESALELQLEIINYIAGFNKGLRKNLQRAWMGVRK